MAIIHGFLQCNCFLRCNCGILTEHESGVCCNCAMLIGAVNGSWLECVGGPFDGGTAKVSGSAFFRSGHHLYKLDSSRPRDTVNFGHFWCYAGVSK